MSATFWIKRKQMAAKNREQEQIKAEAQVKEEKTVTEKKTVTETPEKPKKRGAK